LCVQRPKRGITSFIKKTPTAKMILSKKFHAGEKEAAFPVTVTGCSGGL
jgi:hypothetical protein